MRNLVLRGNGVFTAGVLLLLFLTTYHSPSAQVQGDFVFNEILADPPTDISGDANRDGVRDAFDDEFIELVNVSAHVVDISGWTFNTGVSSVVRHTFPANTVLPPGCGILVFGGGIPTGNFGDSIVQVASSGRLYLLNTGETLELLSDLSLLITSATYGSDGGKDESLNRYPELTGPSFVLHSTMSGGSIFSPGTRVDGTLFSSGCPGNDRYIYLPLVFK